MPEVLKIVKKESPVTTGKIASYLNVNWATAQRALSEIEKKGKIEGKSISGRNIWWVK
jgi:Mn-dependent DtxR family transcriptional regulator